jgi:hypothetical protein
MLVLELLIGHGDDGEIDGEEGGGDDIFFGLPVLR